MGSEHTIKACKYVQIYLKFIFRIANFMWKYFILQYYARINNNIFDKNIVFSSVFAFNNS